MHCGWSDYIARQRISSVVMRLGKELESRTETACGLASFLLLPLVELTVDKERTALVLRHKS